MDERDLDFWLAISPAERLRSMWSLVEDIWPFRSNVDLHPDFRDLLAELVRSAVKFAILGGYAVGHHAKPRATKISIC